MSINSKRVDGIVKVAFYIHAIFTVTILFAIIAVVVARGITYIDVDFILSEPEDMGRAGGIFPKIISSAILALFSLVLATLLGVGTAIFLTEYKKKVSIIKVVRYGVESLAGIPSIIYDLFGFIFFVIKLKMGWSALAGILTMAIMILPTIIRTIEEAILAVPRNLRIVSYSLGATKWETIKKVVLPSASPGILTGVMLSLGRTVGETAPIIFTMGSSLRMPHSLLESGRTMAVHFYILARKGISLEKAYATALALILSTLFINVSAYAIMHRVVKGRS